jgi:hypothetical protein
MDRTENQIEFLNLPDDDIEIKSNKLRCNLHPHTVEADFIEVKKKNGRVVIACRYCERFKLENKKITYQAWKDEKENLTDYYIRRLFVLGKGHKLHMLEYPKELVDAKRAVLQLKRYQEDLKKVLKTCEIHGKLYSKDLIKSGKTPAGTQQYKCKECMKILHRNHFQKNKEKVCLKTKLYRINNPDKVKQYYMNDKKNRLKRISQERMRNKIYREKNKEILARKSNALKRKRRQELHDTYIARLLSERHSELSTKDIPKSMIEIKRILIKMKRMIRHEKQNQ